MIENNLVGPLEEIALKYSLILIDTSFFSDPFKNKKNLMTIRGKPLIEEKATSLGKEHQFRIILTDYLKRGLPYFITSLVSEEYLAIRHYPYKKIIRRKCSNNKKLLSLRRQIRDSGKEKGKLINVFQETDRILQLNEEEQCLYDTLSKKYSFFKTLYKHRLSDVDFDFFISGAVISQSRNSSALASNDFGIVRAWNCFLKKEKISPEQFGFFIRRETNLYWKLE